MFNPWAIQLVGLGLFRPFFLSLTRQSHDIFEGFAEKRLKPQRIPDPMLKTWIGQLMMAIRTDFKISAHRIHFFGTPLSFSGRRVTFSPSHW